jgi:hypothetical protein
MGHNFGLQHNTTTDNTVGTDVERQLHVTQSLPLIKPASLKDIMYAGLLTPEAWVAPSSYNFFLTSPHLDSALQDLELVNGPLFVAGEWNRATGELSLSDLFTLPAGRPTAPDLGGTADLVYAFTGGTLVAERRSRLAAPVTCSDSGRRPRAGFYAIVDLHGARPDHLESRLRPATARRCCGYGARRPAGRVFVSPTRTGVDGLVRRWRLQRRRAAR